MNSYTNDETHIYLQIPVFFTARNQPPLDLYRIHMVPEPLNWDTYAGRESKYTSIALEYPTWQQTEKSIWTLLMPLWIHVRYTTWSICVRIFISPQIFKELTCAISIYMDTIETSR